MTIRDYVREQFVTASQDCAGFRAVHPITLKDLGQFDTEDDAVANYDRYMDRLKSDAAEIIEANRREFQTQPATPMHTLCVVDRDH